MLNNGGVIGPVNTATSTSTSGIWRLGEVEQNVKRGTWPTAPVGVLTTTNLLVHLDANNSSSYPGSGTTWTNLIAGQPSGTLSNGPTYSTDSSGGYISFDGTNDSVSFSTTTPFQISSGNAFTKSFWVYLNYNGTGFTTFDGWNNSGRHVTYVDNDRMFSARIGIANDSPGGPLITDYRGKWANFTVTSVVGSNYRYYINGQFFNQSTASFTYTYGGTYHLAGLPYDGFWMNGRMAVYHFYNRALSDAEVLSNVNAYRTRFGV
jgi:hypothetical protein